MRFAFAAECMADSVCTVLPAHLSTDYAVRVRAVASRAISRSVIHRQRAAQRCAFIDRLAAGVAHVT